jgi:DNA/RNA-binding domain of Phe-tRNA-synthetase-like protein
LYIDFFGHYNDIQPCCLPVKDSHMFSCQPSIAPEIFTLRPDFRALSIFVEGVKNASTHPEAAARLEHACKSPCSEPWAEHHLNAWRDAYKAFGAKPQRTPSSAEALLKRARRDGALPNTNAVVDIYNAVSLRFAIPAGGENADAYSGVPHLVRATGAEPFETMQSGLPVTDMPEQGEVVWRDDVGVTCRRWNWRQGTRTRIEDGSTRMWFVLEALDPMPNDAVIAAGAELVCGIKLLSPNAAFRASLATKDGITPHLLTAQ